MFLLECYMYDVVRRRQKRKRYIDWESYYPYKMHLFSYTIWLSGMAIPKKLCKKSTRYQERICKKKLHLLLDKPIPVFQSSL